MQITTWKEGQVAADEVIKVEVRDGVPDQSRIVGECVGFEKGMAYVEMHISTDSPVFDRPLFENNLAALVRDGYGAVMITDTPKFADTRIIEQIKEIGSYCMAHTGVSIDQEKGYGDFFLMINPYDQDLIVNLKSNHGLTHKVKVRSHDVKIFNLQPLLGNDRWAAVSLTAKQRVLLYDLKGQSNDPYLPASLDHLDPFRGEQSLKPSSFRNWGRYKIKAFTRKVGITRL
ncbi:hypothetical protein [Thalassospira xiamenensis]|uniref:hypothetical protein n=1 Tax=Thalassospira xiamenensis TaxID=220697 RepID=UPI000DED5EBF|nr:hypothetical protein [Thalassospira xiamenensis]RCK33573.1 hypothetical protein TH24_21225 [Thalassospira xiamenensis]